MLRFPFWLVTPMTAVTQEASKECGPDWMPLTFSTAAKMTAYLSGRKDGQWEVRLVNRYAAGAVIEELSDRGCAEMCHDVERDGSQGSKIALADLKSAVDEKD